MRRSLFVVVSAVFAVLLTACGGGSSATDDPLAVVLSAPQQVRDAGSMRMSMTMDMGTAQGDISMAMDGIVGYDPLAMSMSGSMTFAGQQAGYDMIMDGSVMYMRMEGLPGPNGQEWIRFDLDAFGEDMGVDLGGIFQSAQNQDPAAMLEFLRGASDDLEVVGTEDVRGVPTTYYIATVNTQKALEQAPVEMTDQLETLAVSMPETYEMHVWIDDDGLPRRMSFTQDSEMAGEPLSMSVTTELWDYGVDVDLPIPTADNVIDYADIPGVA